MTDKYKNIELSVSSSSSINALPAEDREVIDKGLKEIDLYKISDTTHVLKKPNISIKFFEKNIKGLGMVKIAEIGNYYIVFKEGVSETRKKYLLKLVMNKKVVSNYK